jgi:CO dehydrogenase/acetyl-CoA synthase beta subunit
MIPAEIVNKIATDKDIKTVDELRDFLVAHQHPLFVKPSKHASKPQDLAILLSEFGKIKEKSIRFENYTLTIPASDGQEYEIELKNCHITADHIKITKKTK